LKEKLDHFFATFAAFRGFRVPVLPDLKIAYPPYLSKICVHPIHLRLENLCDLSVNCSENSCHFHPLGWMDFMTTLWFFLYLKKTQWSPFFSSLLCGFLFFTGYKKTPFPKETEFLSSRNFAYGVTGGG
jgi:hypothetical protein